MREHIVDPSELEGWRREGDTCLEFILTWLGQINARHRGTMWSGA